MASFSAAAVMVACSTTSLLSDFCLRLFLRQRRKTTAAMIAMSPTAPPTAPPITAPETFEEEPEFDGAGVALAADPAAELGIELGVELAVALIDVLDATEETVDESRMLSAPK